MPAFQKINFPVTREEAVKAAREFAPHMGASYAKTRNSVVPGHENVSRLSPIVRVRLVRENELAQIALDEHEQLYKCEKFVQECHWRSYWRTWLELRPQVWTDYNANVNIQRDGLAKVQIQRIAQIEAGESGVGIMDEFARELRATGYLHNHARMWFAAFWVHVERLPYELGADFFDRHLICSCPASNVLSWRWVAGVQTRGKTYLARRGNLEKYCAEEYLDAGGLEVFESSREAPIPDEPFYEPQTPSYKLASDWDDLSTPAKTGLWITEDDLSPETSDLEPARFSAICSSVVAAPQKSTDSNGLRREYRLLAARDASARAAKQWQSEAANLEAQTPDELAGQLRDWAVGHELKTVVALKPFVGPSSDAVGHVADVLRENGVSLQLLRRDEDAGMYPFAHKGYFAFWQGVKSANRE